MGIIHTTVKQVHSIGVRGMVKDNLKIDMTPMVDLGFLLISFFVITTQLSEPQAMDLYMPKEGHETILARSNALTILLGGNNTVYYYYGDWQEAATRGLIFPTNFSGTNGLRKLIMEKQQQLDADKKSKEGRIGLMLLIKPGKEASYKNVVDALDEATITMVKRYAVIKLSPQEEAWLKGK